MIRSVHCARRHLCRRSAWPARLRYGAIGSRLEWVCPLSNLVGLNVAGSSRSRRLQLQRR
jgi:hypothetical protein